MFIHRRSAAGLAVLALLAAPAAQAARSYDNCTGFIDSLPATITTQGTWCLRKDLATAQASGSAITIGTNNVTVDCNDFKMGGLAAGTATLAHGIDANERQNATVRNCNIRGFHTGIRLVGGNHLVEDNRLEGNTFVGIAVESDGSTIRRNIVSTTGSSTHPDYRLAAIGISTSLGSVDVLDNTIEAVSPKGDGLAYNTATGIHTVSNAGGTIGGNRIRQIVARENGSDVAIAAYEPYGMFITGNHIGGYGGGMAIFCGGTSALVRDNLTSFFSTPIYNCTDGGGNSGL